jgi:HlyD family secretion protein
MVMTTRKTLIFVLAAVICVVAAFAWWTSHSRRPTDSLTLFGNVDLRQVELAFNDSDRIAAVDVQEGDRLAKGQVVASLDTGRLTPEMAQAEAQAAAQSAVVARMHAGSRPQEIAQAKAALAAAEADALNARRQSARLDGLWAADPAQAAVSRQDVETAQAAADAAVARAEAQRKAYELAAIGPRREDIAQAEAQLRAGQAQVAVLRRQLADAQLVSPVAGVVRSRLMEPGEMATPQRPVLTIAETDPKWVRTYVGEADLPKLHPGMAAEVRVDGFPGRSYRGWVGFISSVAEFTPKTVQTAELRTSLVYEVRVFVTDPSDDLRLGMPATVSLSLAPSPPGAAAQAGR